MLLAFKQLNDWAHEKIADRMTCRRRKLKCDEQKPRCGQCRKANRECQLSSRIVFRHQQNASMNAQPDEAGPGNSLRGFYSYKNTFDKGSVWLETPKQLTFVNVTNPYTDPEEPRIQNEFTGSEQYLRSQQGYQWVAESQHCGTATDVHAQGLEALSAAALYVPTGDLTSKASDCFAEQHKSMLQPLTPLMRSSSFLVSTPPSSSSNKNINCKLHAHVDRATTPQIDPALEMSYAPTHTP